MERINDLLIETRRPAALVARESALERAAFSTCMTISKSTYIHDSRLRYLLLLEVLLLVQERENTFTSIPQPAALQTSNEKHLFRLPNFSLLTDSPLRAFL
jgi:hypothetical protein